MNGVVVAARADEPVSTLLRNAVDRRAVADRIAEHVGRAAGRWRPSRHRWGKRSRFGEVQPAPARSLSATGSMSSDQGDNSRTWPHSLTAAPAERAGLENQHIHVSASQLGRSSESGRACADHDDGQGLGSAGQTWCFSSMLGIDSQVSMNATLPIDRQMSMKR